jgi:hypothetical protein
MSGPKINIPTKEETDAAFKEYFARQKSVTAERVKAAVVAVPALKRLCQVMCERSGQPYKVRALLYSLWNGKPVELIEVVSLDWELHQDICAVVLAFGFEGGGVKFFYTAIENEIRAVGQWDWFLEERYNVKAMRDYVAAVDREERE